MEPWLLDNSLTAVHACIDNICYALADLAGVDADPDAEELEPAFMLVGFEALAVQANRLEIELATLRGASPLHFLLTDRPYHNGGKP